MVSSVSVVTPCYNYGHFLAESGGSALDAQDGADVRVLIIGDASPDGSAEVAKQMAAGDPYVEVSIHPTNQDHIATYNEGLLEWADCDYMVLHPMNFQHGQELPSVRTAIRAWSIWSDQWWLNRRFRDAYNCITSPEVVVRTSLQESFGGYDPTLPRLGDVEMSLSAAAREVENWWWWRSWQSRGL